MRKHKHKRKKKIALPTDRNGTPIHVGDWIKFDDGILQVATLTVYSDGGWTIGTDTDDYVADNPGGGVVIPHDWWGES